MCTCPNCESEEYTVIPCPYCNGGEQKNCKECYRHPRTTGKLICDNCFYIFKPPADEQL